MREHQGRFRGKRAENMRGLAVVEIVEASTQRFAVDDDVLLPLRGALLVKDGGMASEHLLDRSYIQLLENDADRGVGRCATPFQTEKLPQTREMDIDEAVDAPVRVCPGHHRQNGEQNHMRQAIQLAFGPTRVLDFGQ